MNNFSNFLKTTFLLSFLSLQIAAYAQPDNDLICNATAIGVSTGCVEGTNVAATISDSVFSIALWGGDVISNDVWYQFVATTPNITVSTDVQGLTLTNTQIAIYSSSDNTCTGVLSQVGADDNSGSNQANNSIANLSLLIPGKVYFIRVDGAGNATGTFCINVSDTFIPGSTPCEAQIVYPNNLSCGVPSGNTTNDHGNRLSNALLPVAAFRPLGKNYCGGDDETNQYGTWTTFIANSTDITITNYVGGFGTAGERDYTLFSAASLDQCADSTLTCIGSNSVSPTGSTTFSGLNIGVKYFILTTLRDTITTTGFRTDMCVKNTVGCTPPANNDCSNAQVVTADQLYNVSTYCATSDVAPAACNVTYTENNIWYKWVTPLDWVGPAFFQLFQQNCSQGDKSGGSQVSVYAPNLICGATANCVGGASYNANTENPHVYYDNNVNVVWTPTPGAAYLISYDGYAGEVCTMKFQITNKASTTEISVNSTQICPGESAVLTASGADSYLWSTGETTEQITVNPLVTTSYNVSSTSGKIGSAIAFVIVKPLPQLSSPLAVDACSGKTFDYIAKSNTSGVTYKWKRKFVAGVTNLGASGNGNVSELLINKTISPIDINYVYVSTANGCTNGPEGDTVVVTVNPAAVIPDQTATICSGKTFIITPKNNVPTTATKVPAGTTYTWSDPSVSPAGIITGSSAIYTGKDTISQTLTNTTHSSIATVTYTVTPSFDSCAGVPFIVTVTVNPSDSSAFTYQYSTYCQNDITADTTARLTGLAGGTFKSNPALNGFDASTGKFNLRASPIGDYYVTYVTNGNCVDSSTFKITITLAPDAHFSYASTAFCQHDANAMPIYQPGASAGVFTSNPAGLTFVSTQTGEIDLSICPSGTYVVTNSIGAAGICLADVQTFTVTINPTPVMTNTLTTTTICSASTLSIGLNASVPSSLIWKATSNTNITGESFTNKTISTINDNIINTSLVQQTLTYTVTPLSTPQGCPGVPQMITVMVNPKPVMTSSSASHTICSGDTVMVPLTTDVTSTFTWMATSNANITGESFTAQTTDTLNNILFNPTTATQTLSYTVTPISSPEGCVGNKQVITAKINPIPKFTNTSTRTICSGNSSPISLSTDVTSTYNWVATDNPHITGETTTPKTTVTFADILTNDTAKAQIVSYTANATSTVGGCPAIPQMISIKVNPTPNITNASADTLCSGELLNVALQSDVTSSYTWIAQDNANTSGESTSPQATSTISNTLDNSTLVGQTIVYTVSPLSTGGSCPGPDQTISVLVNPNPTMTSVTEDLVCGAGHPSSIALTADIASTFAWKTTNNPNTTGESTTMQNTDTINDAIVNLTTDVQILTYTVTPTSMEGSCKGASQLVVQTIAQPRASFSHTPENGTPPLAITFTNSSENSNTYQWLFGDEQTDSSTDPVHTYNSPSTFTVSLVATNNNRCPDTATTTIIVYKLVVSNVFTPNGDGNNDYFAINTLGIASLEMEIFNRWGIKMFASQTPDGKWDGRTTSGKVAEDGTYFYMLKAKGIDGQEYSEKGYLTLLGN